MPPASDNPGSRLRDTMAREERRLLRYAWQLAGDAELARDAVQDVFLKYHTECVAGRAPTNDTAWLFTVCRRRVFRLIGQRQRTTPMDPNSLDGGIESSPSPDRAAVAREDGDTLAAQLEKLPPRDREIVRLKFQNGLSYKEIADVTGLTSGNVGFILHHAVKTLRDGMIRARA